MQHKIISRTNNNRCGCLSFCRQYICMVFVQYVGQHHVPIFQFLYIFYCSHSQHSATDEQFFRFYQRKTHTRQSIEVNKSSLANMHLTTSIDVCLQIEFSISSNSKKYIAAIADTDRMVSVWRKTISLNSIPFDMQSTNEFKSDGQQSVIHTLQELTNENVEDALTRQLTIFSLSLE